MHRLGHVGHVVQQPAELDGAEVGADGKAGLGLQGEDAVTFTLPRLSTVRLSTVRLGYRETMGGVNTVKRDNEVFFISIDTVLPSQCSCRE